MNPQNAVFSYGSMLLITDGNFNYFFNDNNNYTVIIFLVLQAICLIYLKSE